MPLQDSIVRKKKLKRLVNVDVTHVSLVDRPANRTPFRFIKAEDTPAAAGRGVPMHHSLRNMFGAARPEVTSVIAKSAGAAKAAASVLVGAGVPMEAEERDGLHILRKAGVPASPDEITVHSGNRAGVAYTVAHVRNSIVLDSMEGADFNETIAREGFVPGLMTGLDALAETVRAIAMSEDVKTPDAFKERVIKAVSAFGDYVSAMIDNLPVTVFKFERGLMASSPVPGVAGSPGAGGAYGFDEAVYDALFGDGTPEDGARGESPEAAPGGDDGTAGGESGGGGAVSEGVVVAPDDPAPPHPANEAADAMPAAGGGGSGALPGQAPTSAVADAADVTGVAEGVAAEGVATGDKTLAAEGSATDPATDPATGPATDPAALIHAAMEDLSRRMMEQLAGIGEKLDALGKRVDGAETQVESLAKSIGSTVISDADEDADNVVRIRNSGAATGGDIPLLDTAYMRKRG